MKSLQSVLFLLFLISFSGFQVSGFAQAVQGIYSFSSQASLNDEKRLPGTLFIWEKEQFPDPQKVIDDAEAVILSFSERTTLPFTGLAIGWHVDGETPLAHYFHLEIRSRKQGEEWPEWVITNGYLNPEDSPSGLYWAMLYVTSDGNAHDEFEVRITLPAGSAISFLRITAADARYEISHEKMKEFNIESYDPEIPEIIGREGWWGNLPSGELEPGYTPQQIDITHAAVHHTVTSNSPPDPAQVVRQIWDWHVNDNGWLDIGYNFLIDHTGNIYQGRYNPWLESTDVRGAHAGQSNSRSVGIALLGQFEPGATPQVGEPESVALDALVRMISWRFTQRNIDPLAEAAIPVNPSGTRVLPTILGHRDVSATACPGTNLYTLLPEIRNSAEGGTGEFEEPDDEDVVVGPFRLFQNYPNPFRFETTIPFMLEQTRDIRIDLYTVNGVYIRTLYSDRLERGEYAVPVRLDGLASGVYFYELVSRDFRQMKQMVYFR
jgi:hypothetical protein